MNTIYLLVDPRTALVRYVGVTKQPLKTRLKCHLHAARKGEKHHRAAWLRQLLALGLAPIVLSVEVTDDRQREIFWIAHYRCAVPDLTNGTEGGDGVSHPSLELRARIAASVTGFRHTREARAKISAAQQGRSKYQPSGWKKRQPLSPEQRANIAAGRARAVAAGKRPGPAIGHPVSEETRRKISETKRARNKGDPHVQ